MSRSATLRVRSYEEGKEEQEEKRKEQQIDLPLSRFS